MQKQAQQWLDSIIKKDRPARLAILNMVLPQIIPFNRPLGLKVRQLDPDVCRVSIPFKRANKNHLGGLHACAMATVGEYSAGVLLLRRMDYSKLRLVLKTLHVDFAKQGRGKAIAEARWPAENKINFETLREAVDISMMTVVKSDDGASELARVQTIWQIKPWDQVGKK